MQIQTLESDKGIRLMTYFFPQSSISAPTLIWIHGAFEYAERYFPVIDYFHHQGFASLIFDLRGHGSSTGIRGHVRHMREYLEDLRNVLHAWKAHLRGPRILVGHSMGGLIALRYLQETGSNSGMVASFISAPFLGIKVPVPGWKKWLSKAVVTVYPRLSVDNGLNADYLTHDQTQVEAYVSDQRTVKQATAGWFEVMQKAHQTVYQSAPELTGPIHFMLAQQDAIVDNERTLALYHHIPERIHKTLRVFDGFYHELFNEVDREQVFEHMLGLMNDHVD